MCIGSFSSLNTLTGFLGVAESKTRSVIDHEVLLVYGRIQEHSIDKVGITTDTLAMRGQPVEIYSLTAGFTMQRFSEMAMI